MNAATAIHQKSSLATIDLRDLIVGARNEDGSMRELPHPDASPLPSIADLPDLDSGLELLIDQLIGLQPVDVVVKLKSLTTDPVSGLMFQERDPSKQPKLASYTPSAITHLTYFWNSGMRHDRLPRSPGANLLWYKPGTRRVMIDDIRSRVQVDRDVTVRLLTFSKPIIRCICSDEHALETGDLRAVALRLRESARQRGVMDARMWSSWAWDTARMTVYFGEDRRGVRAVANLALSETKAHSWFASGGVHIQGITYWGWTPAENAHGRHVGSRVADRMVAAIWAASDMRERIIGALDSAKHLPLNENQQNALMRRFTVPNVLADDERGATRTLFDLIQRLFRHENTDAKMAGETREALRTGLGELLKRVSEEGIEAVTP